MTMLPITSGSSTPKISVILPVYGRTDFLSQAIDSVFGQTFTDFEFIVVDDNDPDTQFRQNTKEIINLHRSRGREILYLQHDRNKNGAAARNTGFRVSKGEFISFLDSDDLYASTRLQEALTIMRGVSENVGGVYTGVEFRRRGKAYGAFTDACSGNYLTETLACRFKLGTGSNMFLRRRVIEELCGFDEAFWRHQDYEFMVRLFEKYDLAATDAVLVIKNNENFNLPRFSKSLEIKEQYLQKYCSVIEELSLESQDYIFRCNYISLGELALREGLRRESREMYAIAKRHGGAALREKMRRIALWLMSWFRK